VKINNLLVIHNFAILLTFLDAFVSTDLNSNLPVIVPSKKPNMILHASSGLVKNS